MNFWAQYCRTKCKGGRHETACSAVPLPQPPGMLPRNRHFALAPLGPPTCITGGSPACLSSSASTFSSSTQGTGRRSSLARCGWKQGRATDGHVNRCNEPHACLQPDAAARLRLHGQQQGSSASRSNCSRANTQLLNPASSAASLPGHLQQAEDVAHEARGLALQPPAQPRAAHIHTREPCCQQLRLLRNV